MGSQATARVNISEFLDICCRELLRRTDDDAGDFVLSRLDMKVALVEAETAIIEENVWSRELHNRLQQMSYVRVCCSICLANSILTSPDSIREAEENA